MHRVYLNELGEIETLPLSVAAMVLTIVEEATAPEQARLLLRRANQETSTLAARQGIIEIIGRIMVYKFDYLSSEEIDEMLGIKLEETRVYQEAQEKKAKTIALNLLKQGLAIEAIAQATDLTLEQIQQLQAQIGQN